MSGTESFEWRNNDSYDEFTVDDTLDRDGELCITIDPSCYDPVTFYLERKGVKKLRDHPTAVLKEYEGR